MEKKKLDAIFEGAKNTAKGALNKANERAVLMIDQNDDGKLDMDDVSLVADAVGGAVKKGYATLKESAEENRKKNDMNLLKPIFSDDLKSADFCLPKLIQIVEKDKKRAENVVCQGSIGYVSYKGGLRVVNIFEESVDDFGLTFYPYADKDFYYVDPTDRNFYISLDEYFEYLKKARVHELQSVAQDLGAKHFKVTFKEERVSFSGMKAKAKVNVKKAASAEAKHDASEHMFSMINVAAEMSMAGHAPQQPKLKYLQNDTDVKSLIDLRMAGGEGFHNQKISIKMSNTLGIKENDAIKIDNALKGFKVSGNATVASEAKNESRRYLDYEIEF